MSVNKVILVGRVGAKPEVHVFENGDQVANARLATNRRWTDRETQERHEKTDWHNLVFRNGLAKVVDEYVDKGTQLYIEGRSQVRSWTDKDGVERYTNEVVVSEMTMLGSPRQGDHNSDNHDNGAAVAPGLEDDSEPDFDQEPAPKKGSSKKK